MALHATPQGKYQRHAAAIHNNAMAVVASKHPDCDHTARLLSALDAEQPVFVRNGLDYARDLENWYITAALMGAQACDAEVALGIKP